MTPTPFGRRRAAVDFAAPIALLAATLLAASPARSLDTSRPDVQAFIAELGRTCGLAVVTVDERFTSATAADTLIEMGVPKMKRRDKGRIDAMAAALILRRTGDDSSKVAATLTGGG